MQRPEADVEPVGAVKRHAGAYSWEITVRAGTTARVDFHGATPTAQRANANRAEASGLAP